MGVKCSVLSEKLRDCRETMFPKMKRRLSTFMQKYTSSAGNTPRYSQKTSPTSPPTTSPISPQSHLAQLRSYHQPIAKRTSYDSEINNTMDPTMSYRSGPKIPNLFPEIERDSSRHHSKISYSSERNAIVENTNQCIINIKKQKCQQIKVTSEPVKQELFEEITQEEAKKEAAKEAPLEEVVLGNPIQNSVNASLNLTGNSDTIDQSTEEPKRLSKETIEEKIINSKDSEFVYIDYPVNVDKDGTEGSDEECDKEYVEEDDNYTDSADDNV